MWQSTRSRSTGCHSPAVPPLLSASHPGEKTSEHPSGKCGICGTPLRCSATTSRAVVSSMRTALRLTDLRCFMLALESREKRGVAHRQLAVDLQADVGPAANPLTVVQVRVRRVAVARVRLVVAAAGAQRPRPADAAVGLVRDVMLLEKRLLRMPIDAVAHAADLVRVAAGEAMAERDVAVGRDAEQPQPGSARVRLADALVQLLERLLYVREAVVAIGDRRLEVFVGEIAELIEHAIVAIV